MVVLKNFLWKLAERIGAKGVGLIVSLILARILDTEAYGTIAIVTVFISILQVFVDSGLGVSLIQKLNADEIDFSTVFYFNICVASILYLLLFITAPLISTFYKMPELTSLIRVLSIVIIISSIKNVQQAYVARTLQFKRFFFATLGGTIGAGILGIAMALNGFGVWALVAQHMFNTAIDTLILWTTVKWRPTKIFSFERLRSLFNYGWKIMALTLANTINENIRTLVIGKVYTKEDLAFYNRGYQIPETIIYNANTSLSSVLFPVMSRKQEHLEEITDITRLTIRVTTYLILPITMGMAVCAEPFVRLVLTEKWMFCIPYLRIGCAFFSLFSVTSAHYNAYKAIGDSGLYMLLEIVTDVFNILILLFTVRLGIPVIALGMLVTRAFSLICTAVVGRKKLKYRYSEQIFDVLPNMLITMFMGTVVYGIGFFELSDITKLCFQVIVGVFLYIVLSVITKNRSFQYIIDMIKGQHNQ